MKWKKGFAYIMVCTVMVSLAGCGTKPYDLSKEDQEKIADYAAHVVTKHNVKQEEGLLKVSAEETGQAEEETSQQKNTEKKKEEKKTTQEKQSKTAGAEESVVSMNQALKLEEGLKASFARYEVTDSYVEADYFAMNAMSGKTYLVLHITIETEGQDVGCDMLSKNLTFRIRMNGEKEVGAQTSILLNDLSTYQGTIAQGTPQDCVLLFETAKENVENIESLQLKVQDGTTSSIVDLQ